MSTLHALALSARVFEFESPRSRLSAIRSLRKSSERLETTRSQQPDFVRIAFLGDSTVVGKKPHRRPPRRLERFLRVSDRERRYRVVPFGFPGMAAPTYYQVAELPLAGEPHIVIMAFNAISLNLEILSHFSRPEMAGWIPPSRLIEFNRLPLQRIGLTLDETLLYMAIVRSGLDSIWLSATEQQVRILGGIQNALALANGTRTSAEAEEAGDADGDGSKRESREEVEQRYGAALRGIDPDHDAVRFLAAAIELYRRDGADVVVYFVPVNHQHFAKLGVWNEDGMRRTAQVLKDAVTGSGGYFLDLHRKLPDDKFRDQFGHHTMKGGRSGSQAIARRLANVVKAIVEAKSEDES